MRWLWILASLLLIPVAAAQDAAGPEGEATHHRIGYVNVPSILNNSPQVKAVEEALKETFSEREEEIRLRKEAMVEVEQRLRDEGDKLSDSERRRLERSLISGERRLKHLQEEFRDDLALRKSEEINKLRRQIAEVIEAVAKEHTLDMVFETGVVYVSDRVDITSKVLERLTEMDDKQNILDQ